MSVPRPEGAYESGFAETSLAFSIRLRMWSVSCHNRAMSDTNLVEVGPKGRIVIPAHIRRRLGIERGTQLAVLIDNEAVVLVPRDSIERRLHAIFKGVPVSMADELLEERRAEAAVDTL